MVSIAKLARMQPRYRPGDACPRCTRILVSANGSLVKLPNAGEIVYCMSCRQGFPLKEEKA